MHRFPHAILATAAICLGLALSLSSAAGAQSDETAAPQSRLHSYKDPKTRMFLISSPLSGGATVAFDSKEREETSHPAMLFVSLVNQGPQGPAGPAGSGSRGDLRWALKTFSIAELPGGASCTSNSDVP